MTTLRFKLSYCISVFILLSITPAMLTAVMLTQMPEDLTLLKGNLPLLIIAGLFSLLVAEYIYLGLYYRSYSLEFGETHLQTRSLYLPFRRHLRCAYSDIIAIQRGNMRGIMRVITQGGKVFFLPAASFDGGAARVVEELSRRIPSEYMPEDILASLLRYTWKDQLTFALVALTIILSLVFYFPIFGIDILRSHIAWKPVARLGIFANVTASALASDGSPWIVIRTFPREDYYAWHLTTTGIEKWALPSDAKDWGKLSPSSIARDHAGRPWIIFHDRILYWDGNTWQTFFNPSQDFFPDPMVAKQTWEWAMNNDVRWVDHDALMYEIDLSTGLSHAIPWPDSAIQAGFSKIDIHALSNNDLLVLFKKDDEHWLYRLTRDGWQEPGYLIQYPVSGTQTLDFTQDSSGEIWVLSYDSQSTYSIGNLESSTSIWNWHLMPMDETGKDDWFLTLEVDAYGRLWLAGLAAPDDFNNRDDMIAVFGLTPNGKLDEIIRYTNKNSNFQNGSSKLRLGIDGRIWSLDGNSVWMNSNSLVLPKPLPHWLASIPDEPSLGIIILIVVCGLILAIVQYEPRSVIVKDVTPQSHS